MLNTTRVLVCKKQAAIAACSINYAQKRNSFGNKYEHGPTAFLNPEPDYAQWMRDFFGQEGKEFVKKEGKRILKKPFRRAFFAPPQLNSTKIFEDFDSDESIRRWKAAADSDSFHGFSTAQFVRSRAGHALFTGVLDNRLPDDGMTINSGFVAAMGPVNERDSLFAIETYFDWSNYNAFEIKFRGDGRKYSVVLNTGTYTDDTRYYDNHSYPLYTRGGPYWQTVRIPFSKFIFNYKGLIQDEQDGPPLTNIKFVAIALSDKVDGPFSIEIDHMGLRNEAKLIDEETAYEHYAFSHIKFRPLQVDADSE